MGLSSTRSEWYSSTSPTRICIDARKLLTRLCGFSRLPARTQASESVQPVLVHGHADGGIHSYLFKCRNLAACFDAACRDDRVGSRVAQTAKPCEVCSCHCAFTVYVCAQETRAKWFKLRHHFFGLERDALAPAVDGDLSVGGVESDYDFLLRNFFCEVFQKFGVHFSLIEGGASNNDLARAQSGGFFGARKRSNAAT